MFCIVDVLWVNGHLLILMQVGGSDGDLDWQAFWACLVQSKQKGTKPPIVEVFGPVLEKRWAHPY